MARVHLLDDELINKIAAGEVVERPASVVKELVENAIDAGASTVSVSLKDGGRALIEVSDDGLGMAPDDAVLSIKRHTTSKIRKADELFQVSTMGFRGEALASISSVSRFTLQTRTKGADGIRLQCEDGQTHALPWQGPIGTTISVKDLFYNVPARKAFLKTAGAEFASCYEYLSALALSLPQVGFRLVHNDREIFSVSALPVNDAWPRGEEPLRHRMRALFGEEFVAPLLYVTHQGRYAKIEALISPPGQEKGSAKHIHTFVNQRWVRDKLLRNAIMRGYHSHLLKGKFPVVMMHCDIEAALIDVNVHPAKAELRFQYGSEVQNAIAVTIRENLRRGAWAGPREDINPILVSTPQRAEARAKDAKALDDVPVDFDLLLSETKPKAREPELGKRTVMSFDAPARPLSSPAKDSPSPRPKDLVRPERSLNFEAAPRPQRYDPPAAPELRSSPAPERKEVPRAATETRATPMERPAAQPAKAAPHIPEAPHVSQLLAAAKASAQASEGEIPWGELQYVGVFQQCFMFFEHRDRLLVIDQHAFHERILYERLLQNPGLLKQAQPLLMPDVLEFSPVECSRLKEYESTLRAHGFDYEVISDTEVELRSVPTLLMKRDLQSVFQSILNGGQTQEELLHDVLATVACHAAVRAGEDLPEPERKQLLAEAETVDFFLNCPHGRRVLRWWKASQVASWFDRLG